jgi:putative addiction module CopG family antidote
LFGSNIGVAAQNCYGEDMIVRLTEELEALVKKKVRSGRYTDESDVVRDALRALELRDDYESPALEMALLESVRGQHRSYSRATLDRVRRSARRAR